MIFDFEGLWNILKQAGYPGLILALVVLAFVYVGRFTHIFKTPTIRRWAAVVASMLFAGVEPGETLSAVVAAIGLVLSTGLHLLLEALLKGGKEVYVSRKKK
jgi:hypothetical protein